MMEFGSAAGGLRESSSRKVLRGQLKSLCIQMRVENISLFLLDDRIGSYSMSRNSATVEVTMSASLRDTCSRGERARCPLSRVSLGRAGTFRDAAAGRLHPLIEFPWGRLLALCASSGHPRRCQPRMAIPARPALFPLCCVCCCHSHARPSIPMQKAERKAELLHRT